VGDREAGQPPIRGGVDTESGAGDPGRGGHGLMREHDPFRLARRPARGDHQRITGFDRHSARTTPTLAVIADDRVGPNGVEESLDGWRRQAAVDREHGIPGIPRPAQLLDEGRPSREGQGHEGRHPISLAQHLSDNSRSKCFRRRWFRDQNR
jgi:hypothetical protein